MSMRSYIIRIIKVCVTPYEGPPSTPCAGSPSDLAEMLAAAAISDFGNLPLEVWAGHCRRREAEASATAPCASQPGAASPRD
jgi:hypothetical protein